MGVVAIEFTVAAGNRLAADKLPLQAATVRGDVATYPAGAQGGIACFAQKTTGLPPQDGDTLDPWNGSAAEHITVGGNFGDCSTLKIWSGPPGALRLRKSWSLGVAPAGGHTGSYLFDDEPHLPGWIVALEDSDGGTTLPRVITVARGMDVQVGQ